ncbi:trans-sialidase [Trypanosoma conorhini]|uniref:Trans-sialidase n=1 Tax=Trypanosoma conorhini TaxID=83891 RepID=A0A3R7KL04_9TRYP|nr:trans-sialidase [Trypanosoma conorhini]RNE96548.1 trans-sialidase [Trypanosoma conorhini]
MPRHLFSSAALPLLLLCALLMCGGGWTVLAEAEVAGPSPGTAEAPCGAPPAAFPTPSAPSFTAPSLVEVSGGLVAIAQAISGGATAVLAKRIASAASTELWTVAAATEVAAPAQDAVSTPGNNEVSFLSSPTPVVKDGRIYLFVHGARESQGAVGGAAQMYPYLLVGAVTEAAGSEEPKQKTLSRSAPNWTSGLSPPIEERFVAFSLGGGAGVVTADGTLVFPVQATKRKATGDTAGKTVSLVLYSSDPEKGSWRLSAGTSAEGCGTPSVVAWEDNKLFMMAACEDGRRRVYESDNKGETWTEALATLSRVWGNAPASAGPHVQSGFVTATIEGRRVLLVSLPVHSEKEPNKKGQLHLWVADTAHVAPKRGRRRYSSITPEPLTPWIMAASCKHYSLLVSLRFSNGGLALFWVAELHECVSTTPTPGM